MSHGAVFIDWITVSQFHPQGGLPVLVAGVTVWYDAFGNARFERARAASIGGSYDTAVRVQCDGFRVYLSGNVGRFARQDNLFNHGWAGTLRQCNRILLGLGLPPFTNSFRAADGTETRGAVVSRIDLTANYAAGNESRARAVIRWLTARSISRMKRGHHGDDSVWFVNSRRMVKAYIKHLEMVAHGASCDEFVVDWARGQGVVRVEVEMRKRSLSEEGLQDLHAVSDEKLAELFFAETDVLRAVDFDDGPDFLASLPVRSRAYAAAWMGGQDVHALASRATLWRHARVLREYGLNIMEARCLSAFPVRVRVIDLVALERPDWYDLSEAA